MVAPAVDNATMLRGILHMGPPSTADRYLQDYLVGSDEFKVLYEHDLLKDRLVQFLELDSTVIKLRKQLGTFGLFRFTRLGRIAYRTMLAELNQALERRTEAFNEYEMLRRLICFDNALLALLPTEDKQRA